MAAISEFFVWVALCSIAIIDVALPTFVHEKGGATKWTMLNTQDHNKVVQYGISSVHRFNVNVLLNRVAARQNRISEYHRELSQKTRHVRSPSNGNDTNESESAQSELARAVGLRSHGAVGLVDFQQASNSRRGSNVGSDAKVDQGQTRNGGGVLSYTRVSTEANILRNSSKQTKAPSSNHSYSEIGGNDGVSSLEGQDLESVEKDLGGGDVDGPTLDPSTENDQDHAFVEPGSDWSSAKQQWQSAWQLHVYFIGIASAVVAVFSLISVMRLWQRKNLLSQGYFMSLNLLLLIMGTCRAVYFLVDGYNSNGVFHPVLAYCLFNVAFPCLTSAFGILFLALLQSTEILMMSARIQKTRHLIVVITLQFLLSFVTDAIVGMFASVKILMLVCQVVFILWSLVLSVGYMYVFQKLYGASVRRQKQLTHLSQVNLTLDGTMLKPPCSRMMLSVAVKVTLITAVLGVVCAGLQVYAMVIVYGFLSSQPEPWPWWSLQFVMRIVELGMCITMSYVATQPFCYQPTGGTSCFDALYLIPCHRLCAPHSVEDGYESSNRFVYFLKVLGPSKPKPSVDGQTAGEDVNRRHKAHRPTRPTSMLVNDSGFLRFRQEGDLDDNVPDDDNEHTTHKNDKPLPDDSMHYSGIRGITFGEISEKRETSPSLSEPNTPILPMSPNSYDFDGLSKSSAFSLRPPSSIHLRDSIENILQISLDTPEDVGSPTSCSLSNFAMNDNVQCQCNLLEVACGVYNDRVECHAVGPEEVLDFPNVQGEGLPFDGESARVESEANSYSMLQEHRV